MGDREWTADRMGVVKPDLQLMSSNWARPWAMPIDRNRCTIIAWAY
jgi:hypothetical protein